MQLSNPFRLWDTKLTSTTKKLGGRRHKNSARAPLTETQVLAPTPDRAVPGELWSWGLCIIRAIFSLNPISNFFWLKASLLVSICVYGESECSNWSETKGHTTTGVIEGAPASAGVSRQTSQ